MKTREKGVKVWEFRWYEDRQRRTATIGTLKEFSSEAAARRSPAVQAILLRVNSASPLANPTAISFGAVVARYEREEMPERYSTGSAYRSYLKNHIRPRWGELSLAAVKPMPVSDWLKALPLAPKSKGHIRMIMHRIFQCAVRWELIDKNPIDAVEIKGVSKRLTRPQVLTPEQFWQALGNLREPYRTMVLIGGFLGLRAGEIIGLQWSDFSLEEEHSRVLVQRSVVHGRIGDVKTEYSRDYLPLDPTLVEALEQHRTLCYPTEAGWLFANPVTSKPYHQEEIQKTHIAPAGKAAGVAFRIGWKTLRHSYRAWLDQQETRVGVQKELMRHASIQTTMNHYGNALDSSKREANSKVVQMVLNQKPKNRLEGATSQAVQKRLSAIGS